MIKFNAWEKVMLSLFLDIRALEKPKISKVFSLQGIGQSISSGVPIICGLVCFSMYYVFIGDLKLSQTYSLLILFQLLLSPLKVFLWSLVSLKIS